MTSSSTRSSSPFPQTTLHAEISKFCCLVDAYVADGDRDKRLWATKQINRHVKATPFGSFKYGIYLPWHADLDLVITAREYIDNPDFMLQELANKIGSRIADYRIVPKGRVPFLQLWMSKRTTVDCTVCTSNKSVIKCPLHSPLLVQISIKSDSHRGMVTSNYIGNLQRSLGAMRPLVLVLKHFLVLHGLNDSFNGGLSSYSCILLVVAYLREHGRDGDLGLLFRGMISFYASLDVDETAITPGEVRCYRKRRDDERGELLVIVDPLETMQQDANAARSFWRWPDFKIMLAVILQKTENGAWFKEYFSQNCS
jgi:hypothetical protein